MAGISAMSPGITTEGGFMVSRRVVTAAVAVIVPLAVVNTLVISASAAFTPPVQAHGSITCSYGTKTSPVRATFNPPLSRAPGALVHSATQPSEVITLSRAFLRGCNRTPTPTPLVTGGLATTTLTAKIPGILVRPGQWYVGNCATFALMQWAKVGSSFSWSGPTLPLADSVFVTKSVAESRTFQRLGFIASGTTTGSFAGAKSKITAYFDSPSAKAINATCGGATTKVATATISPVLSTLHLGST